MTLPITNNKFVFIVLANLLISGNPSLSFASLAVKLSLWKGIRFELAARSQ